MKKSNYKHLFIAVTIAASFASCGKDTPSGDTNTGNLPSDQTILYRTGINQDELWSVKADGSNNHQIKISLPAGWTLAGEDMTEISDDGKTMAILAYHETDTSDNDAVFICNADGSNLKMITAETSAGIGIQDFIGNSSILYWKENYGNTNEDVNRDGIIDNNDKTDSWADLWIMNPDGSNNHKLNISLPDDIVLGDEEMAKVSSDGKTIFFVTFKGSDESQNSLYKCNIDGTNAQLITTIGNSSIALQSLISNNGLLYRVENNTDELWMVNIDGSNAHKISIDLPTGKTLNDEEMAKATADGKNLIYTVNDGSIYWANIDGSNSTLLLKGNNEDIALQSLY